MSFIDGFVVPVPHDNKQAYLEAATRAFAVFKEYGATRLVECWGEDVPDGKNTDMRRAVQAQPGENVVFSWIVWPSKAVRDEATPRLMSDPRMQPGPDMPFDGRRMIFGGFSVLLDAGA